MNTPVEPESPPMRVEAHPPFWTACYWYGHAFRWRLSPKGQWVQQQCVRCQATGETTLMEKPAPPPPPPPPRWMNPFEPWP